MGVLQRGEPGSFLHLSLRPGRVPALRDAFAVLSALPHKTYFDLNISLLSGTKSCSTFILCFHWLSSGFNHFSKDLLFFQWRMVFGDPNRVPGMLIVYVAMLRSVCVFAYEHLHFYLFLHLSTHIEITIHTPTSTSISNSILHSGFLPFNVFNFIFWQWQNC